MSDDNEFDPYSEKRKYGRHVRRVRRETFAERETRSDAEQMAAGNDRVLDLLGERKS